MCLAIPVRIDIIIDPDTAIADMGGVRKEINVSLVPDLDVGDYVILHVGYALNKLDKAEAEKTLKLFSELNDLEQHADSGLVP